MLWQSSAIQLFALLVFITFLANEAFSFPANIRKGYPNCQSCHVSPTGGGVTTAYGAMTSREFMSTWNVTGDPFPERLRVGADFRYVKILAPGYNRLIFPMQAEGEIAVAPTKELWLVGSGGFYGEDRVKEYRRHYLLLNLNDHLSVRMGRFFPAYGIHHPDHTLNTRSALGFSEGHETYNGELAIKGGLGEVFITSVLGSETHVNMTRDEGYQAETEGKSGYTVRVAGYAGKTVVGFSYLKKEYYNAGGPYLMAGLTDDLYALTEVDKVFTPGVEDTLISSNQLGYVVFKGFHTIWQYEGECVHKCLHKNSLILNWFPVPHVEVLTKYTSDKTFVLMGHLYL